MLRLLRERPAHVPQREVLLDRCFGAERHLKACETLRRGRRPAEGLAFSLVDGPRLIGTLRFWPIIAGSAGSALLLGPIAVLPERQSEGLGTLMIRHGIAEARRRDQAAILLVGDAGYYARFGFDQALTRCLTLPGLAERERLLALELTPGALERAVGTVRANDFPEMLPAIAKLAPCKPMFVTSMWPLPPR